jgi:hypothetical protein
MSGVRGLGDLDWFKCLTLSYENGDSNQDFDHPKITRQQSTLQPLQKSPFTLILAAECNWTCVGRQFVASWHTVPFVGHTQLHNPGSTYLDLRDKGKPGVSLRRKAMGPSSGGSPGYRTILDLVGDPLVQVQLLQTGKIRWLSTLVVLDRC